MELVSNKIIGYLLLIIGLVIIFWGIYASYDIFTGRNEAPKVFSYNNEGIIDLDNQNAEVKIDDKFVIDKSKLTDPNYLKSLKEEQKVRIDSVLQDQIGNQIKEIIPDKFVLKLLNLSSWLLFIFILVFAGSKISGLGIKLMKE